MFMRRLESRRKKRPIPHTSPPMPTNNITLSQVHMLLPIRTTPRLILLLKVITL